MAMPEKVPEQARPSVPLLGASASVLSRVRKNIAVILSGNATASLFGFAALAFNARALGPESLGVLALLTAYVAVVSRVFSFDSWQSVVSLGGQALTESDMPRLRDLVGFGIALDLFVAFCAFVVGVGLVSLALPALKIDPQNQGFAYIYSLALLCGFSSASNGALRLFDRFSWVSSIQVVASAVNLALSALFFVLQAPLMTYVILGVALIAVPPVLTAALAVHVTQQHTNLRISQTNWANRALLRRFGRFSIWTSAASTAATARQNADVFILAALAPSAAVGTFAVAQKLAQPINMIAQAMRIAVLPEFSRAQSQETIARLVSAFARFSALVATAGCAGLIVFYALSRPILTVLFGEQFGGGGLAVTLMLAAMLLYCIGSVWLSFLVARKGAFPIFLANVAALVCQVLASLWWVPTLGVTGSALATCVGLGVWLMAVCVLAAQEVAKIKGSPTGSAA